MKEHCNLSEQKAWLEYEQSFNSKVNADVQNEFWSYGEYELVGHGRQTNDECGKFKKFMGCLNVEAHNEARWFTEGLKKNSVFVKPIYHSCDKPTCPICFKFGWAVRQASRMEQRLQAASNRLGLPVEHIVVSVPSRLYGESLEALRKKAIKIMANRGIIGGSIIFHGFRYANREEAARLSCAWLCWWRRLRALQMLQGC
jgi:hypothetical protein